MFIEYHSEVLLDMIRYYFFIPILENSSKICKILFLYVLLLVKFWWHIFGKDERFSIIIPSNFFVSFEITEEMIVFIL